MSNNPAGNGIRKIIQASGKERRSLAFFEATRAARTNSGLFFSTNEKTVAAYGHAGRATLYVSQTIQFNRDRANGQRVAARLSK
jgi:hypothetical protein